MFSFCPRGIKSKNKKHSVESGRKAQDGFWENHCKVVTVHCCQVLNFKLSGATALLTLCNFVHERHFVYLFVCIGETQSISESQTVTVYSRQQLYLDCLPVLPSLSRSCSQSHRYLLLPSPWLLRLSLYPWGYETSNARI